MWSSAMPCLPSGSFPGFGHISEVASYEEICYLSSDDCSQNWCEPILARKHQDSGYILTSGVNWVQLGAGTAEGVAGGTYITPARIKMY